jgi:co-chaperonin GroES (HSP10)
MRPIKNGVFIKPNDESTTASGIILGEKDRKDAKLETGIVVAVGKDAMKSIIPGQKVCYERYSGVNIMIDSIAHLKMPDKDVLGIFL